MKSCFLLLSIFALSVGHGVEISEDKEIAANDSRTLSRTDAMPKENLEGKSDNFLEGYIQALVDTHYYEFRVLVFVQDGHVYLYNLPKNNLIANSIFNFVGDLPEVKSVRIIDEFPDKELEKRERDVARVSGIWFPQQTVLFQPLIADPWEPIYSVAYRRGDNILGKNSIAVALGDSFPIYRWRNVFRWKGDLQLDIAAGIWSVFNMHRTRNDEFSELMNTDYMLAIPLSYAVDKWAFRLRAYHISSHLGDEFLVNHPGFKRVNPSMEALDFFVSYQYNQGLRLYIGPGWVFHSDNSFYINPLYIEYGLEGRFLGYKSSYHALFGTWYTAVNVRNWQVNDWYFDVTAQFGHEWSKLQGVGRKMRIYGHFHHGYSEGQFFKEITTYGGVGLSWGF